MSSKKRSPHCWLRRAGWHIVCNDNGIGRELVAVANTLLREAEHQRSMEHQRKLASRRNGRPSLRAAFGRLHG